MSIGLVFVFITTGAAYVFPVGRLDALGSAFWLYHVGTALSLRASDAEDAGGCGGGRPLLGRPRHPQGMPHLRIILPGAAPFLPPVHGSARMPAV
mmetsp:Transcript_41746/g.129956  ORF Transcript_41746/g.129956 Transcript_41746/m.129956 type:complete len:95 (-) Transcript_41746:111-395(-)